MAIGIDITVQENAIDDGTLNIKDEFAFVGFNLLEETNCVEFYFYLENENSDIYLMKTMFTFDNESSTDVAFLESPLHDTINLNKLAKDDPDKLSTVLMEIAKDRHYYTSFKAIKINNDKVTCIGVHRDDDEQHKIYFIIPLSIYYRIHILKNQMVYNVPINLFIDQDIAFDHIRVHEKCDISYIGCDATSYSSQILPFFSLKDDKDFKLGLLSPIPALNDKIISSNTLTKEQFMQLYENVFIVNMTRLFIIDWIEDDKPVKKVCIYQRNKENVNIFMISGDPKECKLLNPYKEVYK